MRRSWIAGVALFCGMWLTAGSARGERANDTVAGVGGLFAEIFVHESGHAITGLMTGYRVTAFKPFPHICGGKFVGGCVELGSRTGNGVIPWIGSTARSAIVSASGSMFGIMSAAIVAPMLPSVRNPTNRALLDAMVTYQIADWPFYIVLDIMGFGGDWRSFSDDTGVPLWLLLPVSAVQYVGMQRFHARYQRKARERYPEDYGLTSESQAFTPSYLLTLLKLAL